MNIAHWVFGPQLVGLIMLLVGCIQKYFPPRHINNWYGYRTGSSTKNQQTWDVANSYSAKLMIKLGLIAICLGLIMAALIDIKLELIMAISTMFTGIGFPVVMLIMTEKHLDKTFDNKA